MRFTGEITVPGDKSITHRALILGSIANGVSRINNALFSKDCIATINCLKLLGVKIKISDHICIYGVGMNGLKEPPSPLYTGNSGTTTRLLSGLVSPQKFSSYIYGDKSIAKRPMNRIIEPLRMMGCNISAHNDNYTPIRISNVPSISGINYHMPVSSAQVKSCILLSALYADSKTEIIENDTSRNHTEIMLKSLGADIFSSGNSVSILPCEKLDNFITSIPGDISSAAFFMVLAAITKGSEITIKNVGFNETRTGIITILKKMGCEIEIFNIKSNVEKTADIYVRNSTLNGVEISGDILPKLIDEIPIICVAAAFAHGKTTIRNASELKYKECNRIDAMVSQLSKVGCRVEKHEDGMTIYGGSKLTPAKLITYDDHRIAMSMSILCLAMGAEPTIDNMDIINISYPSFWHTIESIKKL